MRTSSAQIYHAHPERDAVGRRHLVRDFCRWPIVVAPMAGGPSTPALVAAAAQGDADRVSLWAGEGFRAASTRPAAAIIDELAAGLDRHA